MSKAKKLRQVLDRNDGFGSGHQVVNARVYKRAIPSWALNDTKVKALISRSFPNLFEDEKAHASAARWASVIHLYFRMRYTRSQIAEQLGTTTLKVHNVIRSILRVSKGLRADGGGPLGKKRGRPKKAALLSPKL